MYFKSDLADYAREEYLGFEIIGQKTSLQATVILLTWSESYILAIILQPGLSSQASFLLNVDVTNHFSSLFSSPNMCHRVPQHTTTYHLIHHLTE